jgi:hypothetical protein
MTGKVFSDQTSRFPQTSSRGNKYIMIFYDYDSNAILAEPLKSRSESELLRAFTKLHQYLADRRLHTALHILDNECPKGLKAYIKQAGANLQLAPPNMLPTNAAEKAIDIWKCHFIAGLSSVDPNFLMHLWCWLIEQATTTLNLLRPHASTPGSWHTLNSMVFSATIAPRLRLLASKYLSTKDRPTSAPGIHMESTAGTLALPLSIIGATASTSPQLEPSASPRLSICFHITVPCPKPRLPMPPLKLYSISSMLHSKTLLLLRPLPHSEMISSSPSANWPTFFEPTLCKRQQTPSHL